MDAVQAVGVLVTELGGDQRAVVGSAGGVLGVAEDIGHQRVPAVGHLPVVHVAGGWRREPEAGQRRHDDVERVGRVAAVGGRVGQRPDHLAPEPERPRPTVREDQRDRRWSVAGLADEVDGHAVDLDAMVVELVDGPLGRAPVKAVDPVVDELAQVARADPIELVLVVGVARPTSVLQTPLEILERGVGHVDHERFERQLHCSAYHSNHGGDVSAHESLDRQVRVDAAG